MIVRIWHGITKKNAGAAYKQYVIETGIKEYTSVAGNLGAQIWQREDKELMHIWTISWWKDYDSIKQFAGNDYETARYFEDDKKYLLEFEPHVLHAEAEDFGSVFKHL